MFMLLRKFLRRGKCFNVLFQKPLYMLFKVLLILIFFFDLFTAMNTEKYKYLNNGNSSVLHKKVLHEGPCLQEAQFRISDSFARE